MKLLTDELIKRFEKVGNQGGKGDEAIVVAHYTFKGGECWMVEYDEYSDRFMGYTYVKDVKEISSISNTSVVMNAFFFDKLEEVRNYGKFEEFEGLDGQEDIITIWYYDENENNKGGYYSGVELDMNWKEITVGEVKKLGGY